MQNEADRTIVGRDGRILLFSCERFIDEIVFGNVCFVCGASPNDKQFNDEHIIPKWILRRYDLFDKEIILPNGELKRYTNYRVPCCVDCNSLLGKEIETPVSHLLEEDFAAISARSNDETISLLFIWISLLFFKVHLKDRAIRVEKDRRKGDDAIGDGYDWTDMHHIHAVARSAYTKAVLAPGVVGSMKIYEVEPGLVKEEFDYVDFTLDHTFVIRVGRVGIVATLNDAEVVERAWSERLAVVHGPVSELQLREIGAMFACANRNLVRRPIFSTVVRNGEAVSIVTAHPPEFELREYDRKDFGYALLFAIQNFVDKGAIEVDGSREPAQVASAIASGQVHFLFDEFGNFRQAKTMRSDGS